MKKISVSSIVVDSSVAVKWLITENELYIQQADNILKDLQFGKIKVLLPELARYEISNALLNKKLEIEDLIVVLEKFYNIPLEFVQLNLFQAQLSAKIANDFSITFYDASFIALAITQKADLITDNPKHQEKYKGKEIKIIPLKNYK